MTARCGGADTAAPARACRIEHGRRAIISPKNRTLWQALRRLLAPPAAASEETIDDELTVFRALADNTLDAICKTDPVGNIIYANQAFYALFGYDPDAGDLIGQQLIYLVPVGLKATFGRIFAMAQKEGWRGEISLRRKDGSLFHALLTAFPQRIADGEPAARMVMTFRDITERVHAEVALRESETKYRRLVEATTDWVWATDAPGVITFSNRAITRLLGYEVDEVVGVSVFEMIHPEDQDRTRATVMDAAERQAGWTDSAIRWFHKDGSIRHFESSGQPIFDIEGNLTGFHGIDRDVTERIRAEEALRESEARYRALAENSPVGIWHVDPEGKTLYANPAMCAMLELEGFDDLKGAPSQSYFTPESRAIVDAEFAKRREGMSSTYEAELLGRRGGCRSVMVSGAPVLSPTGDVLSVIGTFVDITAQKRVEEALREERDFTAAVLDVVGALVVVLNAEGQIVRFNQACEETTGYTSEEVMGQALWDLFLVPEEIEPVQGVFAELRAGQFPNTFENYWKTKDGRQRLIAWANTAIVGPDGAVTYVIGTGIDVTEHRRAQEELCESEARYRGLFDGVPIGLYRSDPEGRFIDVNPALVAMLGYPDHETLMEISIPDLYVDIAEMEQGKEPGRKSGDPRSFEVQLRRRDGEIIWVAGRSRGVRDDAGQVLYYEGAITDVTQRRHAEEALRESETRYRGLFDGVPIGLYRCTPDWRFIDVNPALVTMLGYPDKETLLEILIPDLYVDSAELEQGQISGRIRGDPRRFEVRLRRYDGEIIWVAGNNRGARDDAGQVLYYEGAVTDVTQRKRTEQAESEQRAMAEALRDSASALTSTLNFDEVLERILANVERVVPHSWADVMLIQAGVAQVVQGKSTEPGEMQTDVFFWRVADTPNLRYMAETHQPLTIADTHAWPEWIRTPGTDWIRSYVAAPIIIEGQVIGFLSLPSATPGYYTPAHAERLQAFADQAAIAIRNARLFRNTNRQLGELRALADASHLIASELNLEQLLEALHDQIVQIAPADFYLLALYDEATNIVSIEVSVDEGERYPKEQYVLDRGLLRLIIHERQSLRFDSLTEEKGGLDIEIVQAGSDKLNHGWLGVPMIYGDKVVGAIILGSYERAAFDEGHEQTLTSIANQAAVAIENARLYERIRRRQRYLEALHRVSRRAVPEQDPQRLMQAIVDALAEGFGYQTAAILLANESARELEIVALSSIDPITLRMGMGYRQSFDEGILGWVMRHNEPYMANDVKKDPHYIPGPGRTPQGSELAVPIRLRGETIGVFNVEAPAPGAFDDLDQEALLELAEDFALYLENLTLTEQLKAAAAEAERHRLARDLHDAVTQTLWSATLTADVLPRIWERDPEEGRRRLETLTRSTRGALAEMRTLLLELRPATLGGMKLSDLLRQLTTTITNRSGLPVELAITGDCEMLPDVKVALYRIAQEAMNNIVKHANASQIMVCLYCEPERIELVISDDGCGFDPASVPPGHMGLEIARERAGAIGASLEIASEPGTGTQITAVWHTANQGGDAHD